jgi:hypothetical protein
MKYIITESQNLQMRKVNFFKEYLENLLSKYEWFNGDVEISFLPTPTINISEAVLLNYKHKPTFSKEEELFNFYAKNIKIKFSIFDIYNDSLASEIEFVDGFFEVFSDPKNIPNRNNKITDVLVGYKKLPAVSPTESGLSISNKIFKFSEIVDDDFRHYLDKVPSIRMKNCSFSFFVPTMLCMLSLENTKIQIGNCKLAIDAISLKDEAKLPSPSMHKTGVSG